MKSDPVSANRALTHFELSAVMETGQLNQWIFGKILDYTDGDILEINSRNTGLSTLFIQHGKSVNLSDPEECYCDLLTRQYSNEPLVTAIYHIDLKQDRIKMANSNLRHSFNAVLAFNIGEHATFGKVAAANLNELLLPNGHLITCIPICTGLYDELDGGFNYWHRWNMNEIKKVLPKSLEIIKIRYFNLIGAVDRLLTGYRLSRLSVASGSTTRFQDLVPLFQIEDLAFNRKGLFAIVVAQKKQNL